MRFVKEIKKGLLMPIGLLEKALSRSAKEKHVYEKDLKRREARKKVQAVAAGKGSKKEKQVW